MIKEKGLIEFAKEGLGLFEPVSLEITPLSVRGSDRTFYRIKGQDKGAILIHYDPIRIENLYYAGIGRFLKDISISVPEIFSHDPTNYLILMEDLGDTDLWSLRFKPWDSRKALYEKTLENIIRLHSYPLSVFSCKGIRIMDGFDESLYTWEHRYFIENFAIGFCNLPHEILLNPRLKKEFDMLIKRLIDSRQTLIHRDLQSQNVMIKDAMPYLIDFQGMRIGNPLYDLASLLNDPYAALSIDEKEYLLDLYRKNFYTEIDALSFRELFWCSSCQRLMQALGAYGFLGLKKGLKSFLMYIPAGLKNLMDSVSNIPFMPYLTEIVKMCQGRGEVTEG